MRLRTFAAGVVLPLAAWSVPLVALPATQRDSATIQNKIQTRQGKIGRKKGTERVLSTRDRRLQRPDRPLQANIDRLRAREAAVQAELDAKRAELAQHPGRPARRARAARPAAQAARRGPRRARPRLASSTRPTARHRHRRARLERLRRPARAQRLPAPDLRAGPQISTSSRRAGRRDGHRTRLDALEQRQQKSPRDPAPPQRDRARSSRHLVDTRVGYDGTRADKQHALASVRAERHQLEDNLAEPQGPAGEDPGDAAGRPAATCPPARSSAAAAADLAGQRPDHLAVLRAPRLGGLPPRHRHRRPERARRSAPPRPGGRAACSRTAPRAATATTRASSTPRAVHLLRAPVAFRASLGQQSARARSSATPAAPAVLRRAPALRGAGQRRRVEPAELPLSARRPTQVALPGPGVGLAVREGSPARHCARGARPPP